MKIGRFRQGAVIAAWTAAGLLVAALLFLQMERIAAADREFARASGTLAQPTPEEGEARLALRAAWNQPSDF